MKLYKHIFIIYSIVMDKDEKIKEMEEQISNLETELQSTKEHLKKYTAPASIREYYVCDKIKEFLKHE